MTSVDDLVREGRRAILTRDEKQAAKRQREWDRLVADYGCRVDLTLPLDDEAVEAIIWLELSSLGIDVKQTYAKDDPERLPVSTLVSALECLNWQSQLAGLPPAFSNWRARHDRVWKNLQRSYLTRNAKYASTPLMLDELLRLVAWLMTPTPETIRAAALVALALDPELTYDGTDRPISWAWLAALQVEQVTDLGPGGLQLRSVDQVERTVLCAPGPTADAVREAISTRNPPLRDDSGRIVLVGGQVQRVAYSGRLWTNETGEPLTAQGIRHRVAGLLARVVPDVNRVTEVSGRAVIFRVDAETRERAILRAAEPTSKRLRDAAWLANAWWVAARGLEMLTRRVAHATIMDEGVTWLLPRKSDSDGRRPFYGAPHLVDLWTDPRQLLVWWLERLQEEWRVKRGESLSTQAPIYPHKLSAAGLKTAPDRTGTANGALQAYIEGYNGNVEPELRIIGRFTSHSLRSGFAVSGRALGLPTETVMLAGDWNDTDTFLMYLRRAAPLTAGEAGLQLATKSSLAGAGAPAELLHRLAALRPAPETGRLCGHEHCLSGATTVAEGAQHPAR